MPKTYLTPNIEQAQITSRFNLIETDLQVIMAHSEGQFESNKLGEAENLLYLSVSGI